MTAYVRIRNTVKIVFSLFEEEDVTSLKPTAARIVVMGVTAVLLTAGSTWLTLNSENLSEETWIVAVIRVLLILGPVAVGMYAWVRRPTSRFAKVMIVWGLAVVLISLNTSSNPLLYTFATVFTVLPYAFFLTVFIFLSYPYGHLDTRPARFIAIGSIGVGVAWIAGMLFDANPPTLDWFVQCGEACPENLLFVVDNSELASIFAAVSRLGTAAVAAVLIAVLVYRLYHASRPMRRIFLPVVVMYVLAAIPVAIYNAAVNASADADTVSRLVIAVGVSRSAIPLGILVGMISGKMFAGTALERLLSQLSRDSDAEQLQAALVDGLGDPDLRIGYWLPDREVYVDGAGRPFELPSADSEQIVTNVERDGSPVAAVVHDQALAQEPGMVEAAASAALLTLENARLEAELRASIVDLRSSRARIVAAADGERERIERDLHDGAQARLVALRIDLELLADLAEEDPDLVAKRLTELSEQVDEGLEDLRQLAHGIYPPLLRDHGLDDALQAAALRSSVPTRIETEGIGRYPSEVESAVYFCCLEALQNVNKHAGRDAIATVRIWEDHQGDLRFEIKDTGTGFTARGSWEGVGIRNMRDRLGAVGGDLALASEAGSGTVLSGRIPDMESLLKK